MVITRAGEADLPAIYQLEQECFTTPWSLEALYEDICVNRNIYFVLRAGDMVLGYGGMWMILDEAHITNICVTHRERQKGYGHMLLQRMIEEAFYQGADSMTLEVRGSNIHAISLYKDFDFEIEGVRKGYYSDNGEDAFIMWKQGIKKEMLLLGYNVSSRTKNDYMERSDAR